MNPDMASAHISDVTESFCIRIQTFPSPASFKNHGNDYEQRENLDTSEKHVKCEDQL
jgi:hypothetical protein